MIIDIKRAVVGDRVKFVEERNSYIVQARNNRFLVCNRPFPLRNTVLYTIVDLYKQIRGTENLIFGFGAETQKECEEMLARLILPCPALGKHGTEFPTAISYRNNVPLVIQWVKSK